MDTKRLLPGKADDYQVSPASVDNVLGFWDRVAEGKTWSRVNEGPPLTETTHSVPYPAKLSPTPMGPSSAALSTTVASPEQVVPASRSFLLQNQSQAWLERTVFLI